MTQKELADAAKRKIDQSTPEQLGELTVEIIARQFKNYKWKRKSFNLSFY